MKLFKSWQFLLFITASLLTAGLSACSLAADVTPPPDYVPPVEEQSDLRVISYPLVPPDPEQGAAAYTEKCAPCHGDTGMGDGPQSTKLPNPVTAIGSVEVARQSIPSDWFDMVTNGNLERFMPGFVNSLNDSQRWNVVAYVYSLSATPEEVELGKAVYVEQCAGCHGETGRGDGPQADGLSAPPTDFTNAQWASAQSLDSLVEVIRNGQGEMPAFDGLLVEDLQYAAARYARSLSLGPVPAPSQQAGADTTPQPTDAAEAAARPDATGAAPSTVPLPRTVSGMVSNGSGEALPENLTVTLHGFDAMVEALTLTTEVNPDGSYQFENVEMVTDRVFMATVAYKDATFSSDVAHSSDGSAPIELPVTIYEYTSDTSALSVDRMHVFFDFTNPGTVQVVELYIISNNSKRVVTAQETGQPVLNFNLPEAASNLQFQDSVLGERYVETETGFGDTASILPGAGQHQILFAFDLPYENKASFSLPAPLPVQAVVLMLPDSGVKLKGDGLVDGGARDVQGSQFRLYNASNLEAGSDLEISLSGKPSQDISGAQPENRTNLILGLGVFGLALTISGYYIYRSRNKPNPNAEETIGGEADPEPVPPEDEDTDTLFEAIITLDDQFRAGKLPEAAYRERRAELKARLSEKMKGA